MAGHSTGYIRQDTLVDAGRELETVMKAWYFSDEGRQRGPTSEAELADMFARRVLGPETLVWSAEFGREWRAASKTRLLVPLGEIPPAVPVQAPTELQRGTKKPLSKAEAPDERFAIFIALSPVLDILIDLLYALAGYDRLTAPIGGLGISATIFVALLIVAGKDADQIRAAGRNPESKRLVPYLLLTPVVYFLRRAAIAGGTLTYLWVWVIGVLFWIVLQVTVFEAVRAAISGNPSPAYGLDSEQVVAEYQDWKVTLSEDRDTGNPTCKLFNFDGDRAFGLTYTYDVVTLFMSRRSWGSLDKSVSGRTVQFYIESTGPMTVPVSVRSNALVANFVGLPEGEMGSRYLMQPFFVGVERSMSVVFPGTEGRWSFAMAPSRTIAGDFDRCVEQVKNAGGSTPGAKPF